MLKVDQAHLQALEQRYPNLMGTIRALEGDPLPACAHCQSEDTAIVHVDVRDRLIALASATSKIKLIPNGPKPGEYFCNACQKYFD
jgi:hypothetical protein